MYVTHSRSQYLYTNIDHELPPNNIDHSANFHIFKALHPLLEDGTLEQEGLARSSRCAFIGISNWALDPAKMNRGVFVQRGTLGEDELEKISRYALFNGLSAYLTDLRLFIWLRHSLKIIIVVVLDQCSKKIITIIS